MQAPARHTGRASSGHSGHSVLVGGRARAHAHKESSLKSVSAVQQLPRLLALRSPRCQVFPRKLISPVVLSTAINTSLSQCNVLTPLTPVCVTGLLVSHWPLAASGSGVEAVTGSRSRSQPGVTQPAEPGRSNQAAPATLSVITLQSHLVITKIHSVYASALHCKGHGLNEPLQFCTFLIITLVISQAQTQVRVAWSA